jgi:hypothetical protein
LLDLPEFDLPVRGVARLRRTCLCLAISLFGNSDQRRFSMPGKKHVRGVSEKEQRQYEHIKESAQHSGRYGSRAKEVAARTVLKTHKEKGHSQGH